MAEDAAIEDEAPPRGRRPIALTVAKWAGIVLTALLALLLAGFVFLNTDAGRRFVAGQIEALEFENGMRIGIGDLDGSLFGELRIEGLTIADPKGAFLTVPKASLDWRPLAYLFGHVDVRSLTAETAILQRVPEFRPVPSEEPLLPDLDIDVGEFRIARFVAEPAVTGQRRTLSLAGTAHIADRRAQVEFTGETLGPVGGDRLKAVLDAVPEANRLDLQASLFAPQDGVIAALAGLGQPLRAELAGKGDWAAWDGTLDTTLGAERLAHLALSARDGKFGVTGTLHAAGLLKGQASTFLGASTAIDLTADFDQRRADLAGTMRSDTFTLDASGVVDLGENSFDGLDLSLAILRPAVLTPNLTASNLRGNFTLDGEFTSPRVAYDFAAGAIGINDIRLVQLRARGNATMDEDGYLVPVNATAARIEGLDALAGGTLTDVRLGGTLAVQGMRAVSDDLRLRSTRIDARVTAIADFAKGFYAGAINGRINDYRIDSVGIFNVDTDVDLKTERGGFALEGRVLARSTRLLNDTLASLLGGQATIGSNVRYGTDGIVRASAIRLEAPLVTVADGSGTYSPSGAISLELDAQSQRYGPLGLALSGTLAEPKAVLTAERPGLGIGLADLTAEITGTGAAYRFAARGATDYGPLTADVTLDTANPLTIDVNSANLGGIDFSGRLRQAPTGPFTGRLVADGQGLGGVATLSARGEYQQADFNLRARDLRLEGAVGLAAGSAIVDGRVVLYDRPELVLDAQLADARYGDLRLSAGRAKVDYRGGRGTAQFVVEGTRGVPFRLAGNARMEPDLWRATLAGKMRGIDVSTDGAARIVPRDGSYELLPARLKIGSGSVTLAGEYGAGLQLQSRMEDMDLALANAFVPGLGIGGKASGSLDFAQPSPASFPRADARLKIDDFTRTTAVSVSDPVDVNFTGALLPDGGEGSAVFRRGGSVIGRMQASLRPLGPGAGPWMERLMGAPLSGGIRYNGPAGTLFSLAGQRDQRLSGTIGVAADFSGRVRNPRLEGIVKAENLTYENLVYGTQLTGMQVDARFAGDRIELNRLQARAGNGTVEASGNISLAADRGFPMEVAIKLDRARLARGDDLSATATGDLTLTKKAGETALLSGRLQLPETRYRFVRQAVSEVPRLTGVRFKPEPGRTRITGDEPAEALPALFEGLRLDIALTAREELYVSGMGLESEWSADLAVGGTSDSPSLTGTVELVRGTLGFAGRSFTLQEGLIRFYREATIDPSITIVAAEDVDDITVNLRVTGRSSNPQIAFTSVPGLPQEEIVSRILFGRSAENISSIQAIQLAASLNTLRGGGGGLNTLGKLRSATGLDRLRILGADEETGRSTAIAAGRYLTDDIYIEVITDARGFTATQLEISLTPALSVLSSAGGSGTTDVSLEYKLNY
jgi:translocation and assembly module TamB